MKNVQEVSGPELENIEEMPLMVEEEKKHTADSFKESIFGKVFIEAQALLETSSYRDFAKIHLFPDIGLTKLEISIGTLDMTSTALNNLSLTYDNTLNVNFLYNPDVLSYYP